MLDQRDQDIFAQRVAALDRIDRPRVGDFVVFTDGVRRRIAYRWPDGDVQTCHPCASFYLGDGYVSMSGNLYRSVPADTLSLTEETAEGGVWFFHHNYATAGGGVQATHRFRVWRCSLDAPTY
jgi:hypothetical protein